MRVSRPQQSQKAHGAGRQLWQIAMLMGAWVTSTCITGCSPDTEAEQEQTQAIGNADKPMTVAATRLPISDQGSVSRASSGEASQTHVIVSSEKGGRSKTVPERMKKLPGKEVGLKVAPLDKVAQTSSLHLEKQNLETIEKLRVKPEHRQP